MMMMAGCASGGSGGSDVVASPDRQQDGPFSRRRQVDYKPYDQKVS